MGVGDKFIVESELANPYAGCGVQKEFRIAQAHAISRDACIKLDTQKEEVKIFDKKRRPREATESRSQTEIHWRRSMEDRMKTLWGQIDNLTYQLANMDGPNVHHRQPTPWRKAWIKEEILRHANLTLIRQPQLHLLNLYMDGEGEPVNVGFQESEFLK